MITKRLTAIALFCVLAMVGTMAISAQQDPEIIDNECYTGGLWEGKCETEWHWECGWYIFQSLRPAAGVNTFVPEWCNWKVGVSEDDPTDHGLPLYPSANCVYNGSYYDDYSNFNGGWWVEALSIVYADSDCTIQKTIWTTRLVYAPSGYDPEFLCNEAFGTSSNGSPVGALDLYRCN